MDSIISYFPLLTTFNGLFILQHVKAIHTSFHDIRRIKERNFIYNNTDVLSPINKLPSLAKGEY